MVALKDLKKGVQEHSEHDVMGNRTIIVGFKQSGILLCTRGLMFSLEKPKKQVVGRVSINDSWPQDYNASVAIRTLPLCCQELQSQQAEARGCRNMQLLL